MCGRFTLRSSAADLARLFDLEEEDVASGDDRAGRRLRPRFNIAPTQEVLAVRTAQDSGESARIPGREAAWLRWGLVPFWAKDTTMAGRMINARSETVAKKPAFRAAFKSRRCLVPLDGFYEWRRSGRSRQPWFFHLASSDLFAVAGIWERWRDPEGPPDAPALDTVCLLTTAANELLARVHDRMPVILRAEDHRAWLDPDHDRAALASLCAPFPSQEMSAFAVTRHVNSARHDDPECLTPDPGQGRLFGEEEA